MLRARLLRPRAARALLIRAACAASAAGAAGAVSLIAQEIPQRPAGVTDQQIQQAIQSRGLGDQIRQRIQQSGMTPDQIRARLRAAGYSDNLIDQYLGPATPGQAAPAPTLEMLRAAAALGFADFALTDTTRAIPRDSLLLSRADSFLIDTLGFVLGQDSIPTRRDSLGTLRLDTAGLRVLAERLRRARIFGLDVFRRTTNQFAPVTSGPVDPDYRIGPGDELALILTGDVELAHQLPVSREGFVVIPQVGQIQVANLTMAQLRSVLMARLGRVYSGVRPGANATTHFDVTISRVRINQIFVTGDVVRPGAYAVSALGTVMNALYQSGGPTERGSFRRITVMRGGRPVDTLDVYDYLLTGNTRGDIRLESGDAVFVPPHGPRITLEGRVLRPAVYELAPGEGLRDLIRMAGGLLPEAYTGRANIERVLPPQQRLPDGRDRTVLDVDLGAALRPGAEEVALEPDDRVRIFAVTLPVRNRVIVRGDVWHPGSYALTPGERLSQLIEAAGGLRSDAYLDRAHLVRLLPDSTRRLIPVDLRPVVGAGGRGSGGPGGSDPPRAAGGSGGSCASARLRVCASADDPELQEFDEITIFAKTDFRPTRHIAVYGSVQHPGEFVFRDSMRLRDAIMLAGGLRDEAYLLEAEISRVPEVPGGDSLAEIIRVPMDSSFVLDPTAYLRRPTSPAASGVTLMPYDNIFIRRVPNFSFQRNVIVAGEVRFPGRYTISRPDERITDVVNRAGGLMPTAYARGAQFYRAEGRAGRVGIDFERILRDPGYRDNLILLAGDSLYVPPYQPVVQVEGAVNSPVSVAFEPGHNAGWYVDRAGGYTRRADKGGTYIVQANGSVYRRGTRVEPGARVVVPEKPANETGPNWAQIVSTTGTLLASLLSILVLSKQL